MDEIKEVDLMACFKIDDYHDRRIMVKALACAGYCVRIREDKSILNNTSYYVEVYAVVEAQA